VATPSSLLVVASSVHVEERENDYDIEPCDLVYRADLNGIAS